MAEGWARALKRDVLDPSSAGIVAHGLNPSAIQVMAEAGVDISDHQSKTVGDLADTSLDYVVTVCGHAHETCPVMPGSPVVIHHGFDDPPREAAELDDEQARLDVYRRVRDEIRAFIETLPDALTDSR